MFKHFAIFPDDITKQLKLSCKIPSVIQGIINRKIITRVAEEKGITVELNQLQQTVDSLRLLNNLHNANDTWLWLQKYCLSLEEFEELAYSTVLSSKLAQHLFEDKVEPFFFEHQLDYTQVILYEVVLDDTDLAMEFFYALQEGELNFHEVAHQYIQNSELRQCGGYRGLLTRKDLKPEIFAAVFAANPPQIIKPILTSEGVHLILVEKVLQQELTDALRSKIIADLFYKWLKEQTEQLEVITQLP